MALAGGVNVMCAPETMIALSRAHMLAPDGRCKTFDAAADGFARGEGCGIIVLKRLADAETDGDRVLAVLRGAAANQDGRSGGLTVPNGPAQEGVIRAALADAGLTPVDVDYVEAHGTGTSLGDPIEVRALAGAFGPGRASELPLVIGSAKTNFGHLESAAGIAGAIKTILSLQHAWIPPHLHFRNPTPHIPWSSLPVTVAAGGRGWPSTGRARRAGVSSFGFSGTNAHLIFEQAPDHPTHASDSPTFAIPLSARTPVSLTTLATKWRDALRAPNTPPLAVAAATAGIGRSHLAERAAVVASTPAEAVSAFDALSAGREHPAVKRGRVTPGTPTDVVFLFTGQGSQYPGLGMGLYAASPVVRNVLDRCDAALGADSNGRRLLDVLRDATEQSIIHETRWTQPATFAVQMALVEQWRAWGVEPAAVLGHSAGEYAAACAAGVFGLEEGLALIAERGRLMHDLGPGGAMAAVNASADAVMDVIGTFGGRVSIAAYNADDAVVISGEASLIDAAAEEFARRNIECRKLWVPLASHSPLMEPGLDRMESAARRTTMRAPHIPVAWNLTGGAPLSTAAPDALYWRRHLREPVRFADGVRSLWNAGFTTYLEVGPHPVLTPLAQRALGEPSEFAGIPSLRRGKDEWRELVSGLADLYVRGAPIDWSGVAGERAVRAALPTYAFERRRFWIDARPRSARRSTPKPHTAGLSLDRLPTAVPLFETTLVANSPAWLGEHRVLGAPLAAAPVFLELAQAARAMHGDALRDIEDFVIHAPIVVAQNGTRVQIELGGSTGLEFRVHATADASTSEWRLCATGRFAASRAVQSGHAARATSIADTATALGPSAPTGQFYEKLRARGIDLGPTFRGLQSAHRRDGEVLARVALTQSLVGEAFAAHAHPALLDAVLQSLGLSVPDVGAGVTYLLSSIDRVHIGDALPTSFWCHATLEPSVNSRPEQWRGRITLIGDDGRHLGSIEGVTMRRATREALARAANLEPSTSDLFYAVDWQPAPVVASDSAIANADVHAVTSRATQTLDALWSDLDVARYDRLLPALDTLAATYARAALRSLGFDDTPGRALDVAAEHARLGIRARHARLLARIFDVLAESGDLRETGGGYVVARSFSDAPDTTQAPVNIAGSPERDLLVRCGPRLANVLRGTEDPLDLLFPGGELAEARRLYEDAPVARAMNGTIASMVRDLVGSLAPGRALRILEIGGGTGGTTGRVLEAAPGERTEYTFTDISPLFVERALARFARPWFRGQTLDIEREPTEQGFALRSFDLVIAANVLHATADLPRTVRHATSLLAPGGVLVLLEGTSKEPWVDLTFGLTEGWWRFADDARRDYPLLSRDGWRTLLRESGLADAHVLPADASRGRAAQQAILVARVPHVASASARRAWTIVADEGGVGRALGERLRARGDVVAIRAMSDVNAPIHGNLIYLAALDAKDAPGARTRATSSPLAWLGRFVRDANAGRAWLVTRGAQPAADVEAADGRWQAPLWGAGRVFALEQPAHWGGLVDLTPSATANEAVEQLLASLDASDDEDQVAWRNGVRLAARLVVAPPPVEQSEPPVVRADASYLVTGGFGGLGLVVARWLAERGARTIALLGRRPDMTSDGVRAIEATGARVVALAGDVADVDTLSRHLERFGDDLPPLGGVVHCAASFSTAAIGALADADIDAMLRPKLDGTLLLESLTRAHPNAWTVLFSSTTSLLGAAGYAHYAAANAFLDATARAARRDGREVTSIDWGTWDVMRLVTAEGQRSYREAGLQPIDSAEACNAMSSALAARMPNAIVARVDWSTLKPLHEARRRRPFLSRVGNEPSTSSEGPPASTSDAGPLLAARVAALPALARRDAIVDFVAREAAAVLGAAPGESLSPETGLFEMGMDSLMSVELRKRLQRGSGLSLPSTLTFNYPNIGALATFLDAQLATSGASHVSAAIAAPVEPLAIPKTPIPTSDVSSLSDDELEARLLARLEALR